MQPPVDPPVPFAAIARVVRRHRHASAALLAIALVAGLLSALVGRAGEDARGRKTALALDYERSPAAWLDHPRLLGDFQKALDSGSVQAIGVAPSPHAAGTTLLVTTLDGGRFSTTLPGCVPGACNGGMVEQLALRSAGLGIELVAVDIDPRTPSQAALDAVTGSAGSLIVMALVLGGLGVAARRQQRSSGGQAGCLDERPAIRFADVVGAAEAKASLTRVKEFLRDPQQYLALGARAPRGVLLQGPPGTGKTLLAKALAGECGARFIAVDGSYFTSMFYGSGVAKVRQLFALARRHAPCVLFIDEIDGIGKRSTGEMRGGESELNRIINRVLTEMDGFGPACSVVVVGATNHAGNLDDALLRPGRFDLNVQVALPTVLERQALFDLYVAQVRSGGPIDTAALGRMTAGMSPADIAGTVNQAASSAAEQRADAVTHEHLMKAIETRQLGGEVSAATMSVIGEATRRRIARHEAGHALVGHLLAAGTIERVSIEARGPALGATYMTREREEPLYAQKELTARLAMMLGGREAELLAFGDVSSGASDDLKRASELAVQMVSTLGFSQTFGLLSVAGVPRELIGPDVQAAALQEARVMLETAQRACRTLLMRHADRVDALTAALLARDIVSGGALQALLDGRPWLDEATGPNPRTAPRTSSAGRGLALATASTGPEPAGPTLVPGRRGG